MFSGASSNNLFFPIVYVPLKWFSTQNLFHAFNTASSVKIYPRLMLARYRSIVLWKIFHHRPSNAPPRASTVFSTHFTRCHSSDRASRSTPINRLDAAKSRFEDIWSVQASTRLHASPEGFVCHSTHLHTPLQLLHVPPRWSDHQGLWSAPHI
jgi:hypothetical protein